MRPLPTPSPTYLALLDQVRRNPAQAEAAVELGLAAITERRENEALPLLHDASTQSLEPSLDHVIGLVYRALGRLTPALTAFDLALARGSRSPRLLHARARAALEAGLPSLDWFIRARAAAPHDQDLTLSQAAALQAEGESEAADTLLTQAVRSDPRWLAGHETLARLRSVNGRRDTMMEEIAAAIAAMPQLLPLRMLLISVLIQARRLDEAAAAVAAAMTQLGPRAELIEAEAIIATEQGSLAHADEAFARIDPLAGESIRLHWLRHLLRRGQPERMCQVYDRDPLLFGREAWPYLSIAWRLLDDRRAAWLDNPALIREVDLVDDAAELDALAACLRRLHRAVDQPLDQSVRGGTQTDGPLLWRLDPPLQKLRARLSRAVVDYIAALPAPDTAHPTLGHVPASPRFAGSWSVRLAEAGFHDPHVHPRGWLSSAFYVAIPPCGHDPQAGWLTLGAPQESLKTGLQPFRTVQPSPGRLVLFPSVCWHGTRPSAPGERLTVAFDID